MTSGGVRDDGFLAVVSGAQQQCELRHNTIGTDSSASTAAEAVVPCVFTARRPFALIPCEALLPQGPRHGAARSLPSRFGCL
jgi:hypothetical protein